MGDGSFRPDIFVGDPEAWVAERSPAFAAQEAKPRAIEAGPMEFTSCVTLEVWPTIVWDVNAYYAELGVSPRATNREIREAYQRLNGHESERLTYIVKQLLNPSIRANYDRTKAGDVFFDHYIAEYVKEQMLNDQIAEHGHLLTFDERVSLNLDAIDLTKFMDQPFDTVTPRGHDEQGRWAWGYYLWAIEVYDTEKLRQWQGLLVEALARREAIVRLSVGLFSGSEEPMKVEAVGYRVVAFLGQHEQPNQWLAEAAADRVVHTVCKIQTERIPRHV